MTNSKELFSEVTKQISLPEEKGEIDSIVYLLFEKKWKLTRTDILAGKKTDVTWSSIAPFINRINAHEPIQYILGEADFFGRVFQVTPTVLIPRPETELLVSEIIQYTKSCTPTSILDIGTGSGCIAISLALGIPSVVSALDVSLDALQVAQENARKLKASVRFHHQDILQTSITEKFDLIVSNPPYIAHGERHGMKPNVLRYEPHTALFPAGDDPLLFYKVITAQAQRVLNNRGSLWFEINEHYANEISAILTTHGFENVIVQRDWNGKERVVWGLKR